MSVVKEGYVKRYSKSILSGGWNNVYLKLYTDSSLLAYKKQGDRDAKVQICMKDVCKHFAFGEHAAKNFKDMPQLPHGSSISCILAIPEKPSHKAKPHFFLMNNEQHLHEWMTAICSTLPPRQQSAQAPVQQHIQPQTANPVSTGPPPPPYSGPAGGPPMPQPLGFGSMGGGYPTQPGYPQQQYGGYPQQPGPYPQQPGHYPQQPGPYPQQPYAQPMGYPQQAGYPQQQYYGQQPYGYQQPPPPPGYAGGYSQPQQVVYTTGHKKKGGGILSSNTGKMAAGLIGGAALGYGASRMMGGGMFGGFGPFGMGRCGSWSSLSSFGSCGSFGSFGSFD